MRIDTSARYDTAAQSIQSRFGEIGRWIETLDGVGGGPPIAEGVRIRPIHPQGFWRVTDGRGETIAEMGLVFLPNCGPVAVLCGAEVAGEYRGKGIGTRLHQLRLDAARDAGAVLALCTVREGNSRQHRILEGCGWERVGEGFQNPATEHEVGLWQLRLRQE